MSDSMTVKLPTSGMHCQSCAMMIKMTLDDLAGVLESNADPVSGLTTVSFDPEIVDVDAIVSAIKGAGYDAEAPVAS